MVYCVRVTRSAPPCCRQARHWHFSSSPPPSSVSSSVLLRPGVGPFPHSPVCRLRLRPPPVRRALSPCNNRCSRLPRATVAIITYPTSWYFEFVSPARAALSRRHSLARVSPPLCPLEQNPTPLPRTFGLAARSNQDPSPPCPTLRQCPSRQLLETIATTNAPKTHRTRQPIHALRATAIPTPSHQRRPFPLPSCDTRRTFSNFPPTRGSRGEDGRTKLGQGEKKRQKKALGCPSPSRPFDRFLSSECGEVEKSRVGYSMKRLRLIWI
ncbi:hypothetical protein QBC39DRAFT_126213 [Podospora conica]|nr:hypothetical protein QBC39DRAFT_126213 [Schizothecium conicum]